MGVAVTRLENGDNLRGSYSPSSPSSQSNNGSNIKMRPINSSLSTDSFQSHFIQSEQIKNTNDIINNSKFRYNLSKHLNKLTNGHYQQQQEEGRRHSSYCDILNQNAMGSIMNTKRINRSEPPPDLNINEMNHNKLICNDLYIGNNTNSSSGCSSASSSANLSACRRRNVSNYKGEMNQTQQPIEPPKTLPYSSIVKQSNSYLNSLTISSLSSQTPTTPMTPDYDVIATPSPSDDTKSSGISSRFAKTPTSCSSSGSSFRSHRFLVLNNNTTNISCSSSLSQQQQQQQQQIAQLNNNETMVKQSISTKTNNDISTLRKKTSFDNFKDGLRGLTKSKSVCIDEVINNNNCIGGDYESNDRKCRDQTPFPDADNNDFVRKSCASNNNVSRWRKRRKNNSTKIDLNKNQLQSEDSGILNDLSFHLGSGMNQIKSRLKSSLSMFNLKSISKTSLKKSTSTINKSDNNSMKIPTSTSFLVDNQFEGVGEGEEEEEEEEEDDDITSSKSINIINNNNSSGVYSTLSSLNFSNSIHRSLKSFSTTSTSTSASAMSNDNENSFEDDAAPTTVLDTLIEEDRPFPINIKEKRNTFLKSFGQLELNETKTFSSTLNISPLKSKMKPLNTKRSSLRGPFTAIEETIQPLRASTTILPVAFSIPAPPIFSNSINQHNSSTKCLIKIQNDLKPLNHSSRIINDQDKKEIKSQKTVDTMIASFRTNNSSNQLNKVQRQSSFFRNQSLISTTTPHSSTSTSTSTSLNSSIEKEKGLLKKPQAPINNNNKLGPNKIVVQASTTDLLRCFSMFINRKCSNLTKPMIQQQHSMINSHHYHHPPPPPHLLQNMKSLNNYKFDSRETIAWLRSADRSLLLQGWQDVPFMNPVNVVFVYMIVRDTLKYATGLYFLF
jgi:hypothetical protein